MGERLVAQHPWLVAHFSDLLIRLDLAQPLSTHQRLALASARQALQGP